MPSLGDVFGAALTGNNQQDVNMNYALRGAQLQDTLAQAPLRGAQTQEALARAREAQLAAVAAQKKQDAIDNYAKDAVANGSDPHQAQTLGQALATGSNFEQGTAGLGHLQEQHLVDQISSPTSTAEQRFNAQAGLKHEANPYAALPADAVDLRNIPGAGVAPPELVSKVGQATIDAKELKSKDDAIDPNEMAYWGHRFNTTGVAPAFGMGQSKTRQAFLKAAYLDSAGIPITAQSLGIGAPGAGAHGAVAAPAAAPGAPPLSPAEAAEASAARVADTKGANSSIANATKMLGVVDAQSYTAHNVFQRALGYAKKLSEQRGEDGSPLINKAINDWKNGITGDPLTAQFVHDIQTSHDEYAKIMSGATGAQGITDAGRKAADKLFNEKMNYNTLEALGTTMDADAADRKQGYVTSIASARKGIAPTGASPGAAAQAAAATAPPPAAMAGMVEGQKRTFGNGQVWTIQGGKPVQVH